MITAGDIYDYIDQIAPFDTAMSFDNVGILCGSGSTACSGTVLCALDITPPVIKEAENLKANIIVSHHPIIFNPLKSLKSSSVPYLLARAGITAICAHTNLDLAKDGVNTWLAQSLKLQNIVLIENEPIAVGTLSSEMTERQFAQYVKDCLHCTGVRYTQTGKKITTVAVSSGAGGDGIYKAKELGADVLLTGEIKHNFIIEANEIGIAVTDAGHYKTEDIIISPLCQKLNQHFNNINFVKSTSFTDNIEYV